MGLGEAMGSPTVVVSTGTSLVSINLTLGVAESSQLVSGTKAGVSPASIGVAVTSGGSMDAAGTAAVMVVSSMVVVTLGVPHGAVRVSWALIELPW